MISVCKRKFQARKELCEPNNGDFTQLGRERRRERYKTINFITEYNDFDLLSIRKQNVRSSILWVSAEREQQSMNHFNLRAASTCF